MTDNRTTELLPCPMCGAAWPSVQVRWIGFTHTHNGAFSAGYRGECCDCGLITRAFNDEAEAIAAWNTRVAKPCYATDYTHGHCKYSVNRGWVEDTRFFIPTAKQGGSTLTAEQVRKAIKKHAEDDSCYIFEVYGEMCGPIADELNAELGGGNCARCAEDMGRYADSLCDPLKERIVELLRRLENDWHIHASWDGLRKFWCIELTEEGVRLRDAELESGTCEIENEIQHDHDGDECDTYEFVLSCGHSVEWLDSEPPRHCPECGCKVVSV